jgi:hypothetical protein
MRTTLTLDDDVAARLHRLRRERDTSLKALVNDALRRGLEQIDAPPKKTKPFRMRSFNMGTSLVDIDNVAEAIAAAEGEAYK